MLPMLTVSGAPGLVYLNGRLCGETGAAAMPLALDGVQYLELRPFDVDRRGAVLRLNMSGGHLTGGVVGEMFAVQWPDGWIALEMRDGEGMGSVSPTLLAEIDMAGGHYLLVDEGGVPSFGRDAGEALFLPVTGATSVSLRPLPYAGLCVAEGACADGRFVAVMRAEDTPEMASCATGPSARIDSQSVISNVEVADDLVGHASICVFAPDAYGNYSLRSREPAWRDGGPNWPGTPGDTARAWLEAVRYGVREEAAGYLARPPMQQQWEQAVGVFDTVTELPQDGSEGVRWGVLRMEGTNMASVSRLSFVMARQVDHQGEWKIESMIVG